MATYEMPSSSPSCHHTVMLLAWTSSIGSLTTLSSEFTMTLSTTSRGMKQRSWFEWNTHQMDFLIQSDAFVKPKEIWNKLFFVFQHGVFFFSVKGPPPMPELDFGLWARVPQRFFPHPEPTISFSYWSAVSHLKTRDFRFSEPTIPFPPGQWFPTPNHVTSAFPVTSGSGDVIPVTSGSGYVISGWARMPLSNPIVSGCLSG